MDKNLMEMAKINASGLPETICNFYSIMEQKLNELAKEKVISPVILFCIDVIIGW
jgi:hypothetical protein